MTRRRSYPPVGPGWGKRYAPDSGGTPRLVLISGNNQTANVGETLANPIVVEARDGNNDPVTGVSITATPDGGSIDSSPENTNGVGQASFVWTMPATAGNYTLDLTAVGYDGVSAFADALAAEVYLQSPMGLGIVRQL